MNSMKLASKLAAACTTALLAALISLPASAFELKVKSENPLIDEAAIRAATLAAASQVGHRIPEDPDIKVFVFSRALESKIKGQMIYFHRVQLTKAVSGGRPYPVNAWLPVKTIERFGVDEPELIRQQLDVALKDFFTQLQSVSPDQGFK